MRRKAGQHPSGRAPRTATRIVQAARSLSARPPWTLTTGSPQPGAQVQTGGAGVAPLLMAEPRSARLPAGMLPRQAGASERSGHPGPGPPLPLRRRSSAAQFINHGGGWLCTAGRSERPGYLASSQPGALALSPPPAAGPSIIPAQGGGGPDKRMPGSQAM